MNNKENIFQKIKRIFKNIFGNNKLLEEGKNSNVVEIEESQNTNDFETENMREQKNDIFTEAKNRRRILELEKQFISGKIKKEEMSEDEIIALKNLINEQIENTVKTTMDLEKKLKRALLNDKKTMDLLKKYQGGEITKDQMTEKEVLQIEFLYKHSGGY